MLSMNEVSRRLKAGEYVSVEDSLACRVWLTTNEGWASNERRLKLGASVEFTRFGYYDLGDDGIFRRSAIQPALSRYDMD